METPPSHTTLAFLRHLIRAMRGVGNFFARSFLLIGRWVRSSPNIIRTGTALIIHGYDLLRRARNTAKKIHPSGKLRILVMHPLFLYSLTACVFCSVALYNLYTRNIASENLERESIFYRLISADAGAIIVETAAPAPMIAHAGASIPRDSANILPIVSGEEGDELAIFTGEGALVRPNLSETRRGARPRDEIIRYTVQEQDTVSDIAYRFNLSVRTLLWANSLNANSYIRPGDSLVIPQTDGVVHTIQRGDTIDRIASRYRTTAEKIIQINNITKTAVLAPGTIITVPDGVPPSYGQPTTPRRVVARPPAPVSSQRAATGSGSLFWPTTGRAVTQYFSWRHGGLDIDGNLSSPIFAAADGTVEVSRGGWNGGYGNVIIIDHGKGVKTRYGHLSRLSVKAGDKVQGGQLIGIMGSTGRSTGSHLHFEIMIGGARKNPLTYL